MKAIDKAATPATIVSGKIIYSKLNSDLRSDSYLSNLQYR